MQKILLMGLPKPWTEGEYPETFNSLTMEEWITKIYEEIKGKVNWRK